MKLRKLGFSQIFSKTAHATKNLRKGLRSAAQNLLNPIANGQSS